MTPQTVSVVVITHNEASNIARCLESVSWADELIVVDCGSTDRTVQSAREHGAQVIENPWPGYAAQKNLGIDRATHDWILSLDADEWLEERAIAEVRDVLAAPRADGYRIRRRTAFCGEYADRSWSRDLPLRLFRKEHGRFGGGPVHESVHLAPGTVVRRLDGPILHRGYDTIDEYVTRMNRYTDLAATGLHDAGRGFRPLKLWFGPPWAFFRSYLLKLGFLDGVRGWILAAGAAQYVLLREAKLWERRQR